MLGLWEKEIKGESCPFSQLTYSEVPCRFISLDPTYLLDFLSLFSRFPQIWHFTVAQTVYKSTPEKKKTLGECNLWRYLKAIFLTFKRPRDASSKRTVWVQLLGFIATNSSVMMEHRHAVCVGTSNDCIPHGSLCGVLAKIAVCQPAYTSSACVEFPTEPHCSVNSDAARWTQFLTWEAEVLLAIKGAVAAVSGLWFSDSCMQPFILQGLQVTVMYSVSALRL